MKKILTILSLSAIVAISGMAGDFSGYNFAVKGGVAVNNAKHQNMSNYYETDGTFLGAEVSKNISNKVAISSGLEVGFFKKNVQTYALDVNAVYSLKKDLDIYGGLSYNQYSLKI